MVDASSPRSRKLITILVVALLLAAGGAVMVYVKFFRELPAPYFASDEEHFLFGSIGSETEQGVPYWIWLVLPRIFPEYLPGPGGYAALGIPGKDGHEMPVGFSKVTVGVPRVGANCALCHTARYRQRAGDPPTIVAAAASHQTGAQEYARFLTAAAADPRFSADTILGEIAKNRRLSLLDRLLYRVAIIPSTRRRLLQQRSATGWMQARPDWGRGRLDLFNLVKFTTLRQPVDATIGTADTVPIWNLKRHQGYAYQWDGLNTSLTEVVLASAVAGGATPKWIDRDYRQWNNTDPKGMSSLRRIQNYISDVQPPAYPYAIDQTLVSAGRTIFDAQCAACHAFGGPRTGTVIPVTEVGTDRHRLEMWTTQAAVAANAYGEGHPWKFSAFRTTTGYVSVPLDGVWLRAPYLHNGSVPSLRDLLEAVERRPRSFWRGYDVYDPDNIGFISWTPQAQRTGTFYDTARPGNSNAGHLYGTELPPESKRALLEYLKTL